ncbi:MAG: LysR family transcriptional regulator [Gluconacetobacter diazotrophicus]|nr:LysR family transcriptional regulator [Gluconacetobacter diazotrophicus]
MDDLAAFLAVCEAGGFRVAARRTGRSASHLSETVTRLEARLGTPLLQRTTRAVRPTEAGRGLVDRLAPMLGEMRAALRDAGAPDQAVGGTLKLNVPGAVMVDILPPLVDRFLAAHPRVRVELVVEDRLVELLAADCDAGIRYDEHLAQDMVAVPLGPRTQAAALAASPSYLAARGMPAHPRELPSHDCIRLRFTSGAPVRWEFERDGEAMVLDPPGRIVVGVNAVTAAIGFARAGRGIVGTFRNWLEPDLRAGTLVPVLEDWWPEFAGPRLYFARRSVSAPLRAFLDVVEAVRREERGRGS